jgi:hypothetical protein
MVSKLKVVKDTEPPTCRTAATQLVAVGRLLRWGIHLNRRLERERERDR